MAICPTRVMCHVGTVERVCVVTHFTSTTVSVACLQPRSPLDLALLACSREPSMLGYTGVLLCDWAAALISCLVIRCVRIRSLLEVTLFKLLPGVKQRCVTSDCTGGGGHWEHWRGGLYPFHISHSVHKSVKRHWATRAGEPAPFQHRNHK